MKNRAHDSEAYFANIAAQWDDVRTAFFPDSVRDAALAAVSAQSGGIAADIGAGSGFLTAALLKAGFRVIAVDRSPEMLAEIGRKFAGQNVEPRQGESESLPIGDGTVDCALANMYLHHVERPSLAIGEMARVLKPGGRLVITDLDAHGHDWVIDAFHDRWLGFDRANLRQWFAAAGLKNVTIEDLREQCTVESPLDSCPIDFGMFIAKGEK